MRLHLMRTTTIGDVKDQFNEAFPNLKLEFFKVPHQEEALTRAESMYTDESLQLGDLGKIPEAGVHVDIDAADAVWDVEKKYADLAMLYVQIFRKGHNGIWLLTSATDDWSLEKQNRKGALSASQLEEAAEETDYHDQE